MNALNLVHVIVYQVLGVKSHIWIGYGWMWVLIYGPIVNDILLHRNDSDCQNNGGCYMSGFSTMPLGYYY